MKKMKCILCGGDIRIMVHIFTAWKQRSDGKLIPVEDEPLKLDNFDWSTLTGECSNCYEELPESYFSQLTEKDFDIQ